MDDDQQTGEVETPPEGETPEQASRRQRAQQEREEQMRQQTEANTSLQRENAMLRAGIDLDSPLGAMFARAYEGELTKEAIVAAATEVGAIGQAAPPPGSEITDDERRQMDERAGAAAGAQPPTDASHEPPPRERALKEGFDAIDHGATNEEALMAGLDVLATAAIGGDERTTFDPNRERSRPAW